MSISKQELEEKTRNYRRKVELASSWTNDADALECIELFPYWAVGIDVYAGERRQFNKKLYKCVQSHTTQAGWEPNVTPALWVEVSVEEFPAWVQPTGSADSYMKGQKVSHSSKHWRSLVDNNVWEPGIYGWEEVS